MKNNDALSKNPGCLGSLLQMIGRKSGSTGITDLASDQEPNSFPYRVRDDFLSPAEKSFYQVLKSMMGEHFTICPKVSLADVFFVVRPNENKSALNRINRKHVDFLICDPKTIQPLFAIELDDSSHSRPDRVERDEFVDGVYAAANLPLLHIPVRQTYNTAELGVLFKKALQPRSSSTETSVRELSVASPDSSTNEGADAQGMVVSGNSQPPDCPKCGIPMVLRTAKNGDQAGRQFFGCSNYPRCRVTLPVEKS